MIILFNIARFVCAGFGSGWLPLIPGTWGSAAALLPLWWLFEYGGWLWVAGFALVSLIIGCVCCYMVLPKLENDDPGWIVMDEWAGQAITILMLSFFTDDLILLFALSFFMFRLFDIWKPWPIGPLEHVGPPWWAIMADDLAAGLMAGIVSILLLVLWASI
ncbi:MAG: phosphatidylglycerophosphatase A [Mariprofundaceae bacterium]